MEIGKVWLREDNNGNIYWRGTIDAPFLGSMHFAIFKIAYANGRKPSDKHPDRKLLWEGIPIGKLWISHTDDNVPFWRGTIQIPFHGALHFAVFRIDYENGKKPSDKHPDYTILWSPRAQPDDSAGTKPTQSTEEVPF